ncbi:MAG: class I SAM-dependent methyltransferase [Candidatus Diapherotrites archaeon]|uniref:Class I SAM-dependent methyltransferase n=1 Tax=Candidatus Iainarchaeum sp. TaxID=3101447 RepID=A0A8T4KQM6_9ARCH|nr:class I SAM-dependent methyltransferase [Candidatus Diapherotrites archaeon]
MRSLVARGLAKRTSEGKLALTDKGRQRLENLWGVNKKELNKILKQVRKRYPLEITGRGYAYHAFGYIPVLTILKKQLGSLRGKKILEVGFWEIPFLQELKRRGAIVAGVDVTPSSISKHPKEIIKKLNLMEGNVTKLNEILKGQKFDGIVARNLFEIFSAEVTSPLNRNLPWGRFIEEKGTLKEAFAAIRNQLKDGGIFISAEDNRYITAQSSFPGFKRLYLATPELVLEKMAVFKAI